MSDESPEPLAHEIDIDHHVRVYLIVFGALLVLTVLTVAASYLDVHPEAAITVALAIASIKGSLVVCYFMHLNDEKKLVYAVLIFTVIFFFFELLVPLVTQVNSIGTGH